MPYLKFLRLSDVDFDGDFEDSLSKLRWLVWEKYRGSFTATNVHLEKLLILDLSGSFISEIWEGWSSIKMERLKGLNLSLCSHLKSTPNLSALESLERLILENFQNLEEISPSIGDVKCLVSLNWRDCWKLKRLPTPQMGKLENLEELLLDKTGIEEFPDCIGSLKKLKMLSAVGCGQLTRVPTQLGEVKGLVSLNLRACLKLEVLPVEMCKLEELKELIICSTAIKELPPCIGSLTKLEMFDVSNCKSLYGLPDSIGRLVNLLTLDVGRCYSLKILPKSIGSLVKLQCLLLNETLRLRNGNGDAPIESPIPNSIGQLERFTELDLSRTRISELPESIGDLKNLQILRIQNCVNLKTLPSTIRKLGKLEELDASGYTGLGGEVPLDGMSSLRILQLHWTFDFGFPDTIDKLSRLEKLDLSGRRMLRSLPQSNGTLPSLQHLYLTSCEKHRSLLELPVSLTVLKVTCPHRTLPQLSHLIHLKELTVEGCQSLEFMPELPSGLLKLWVNGCGELKELPSLSSLGSLSELALGNCSELTQIVGLEALKSLEELLVYKCPKLSILDLLQSTTHLKHLSTSGCGHVVSIKFEKRGKLESPRLHIPRQPDRSCFPKTKESRWGDREN